MSRFTSKKALLEEIRTEREKFEELLADIPTTRRTEVVTEGMSVKDFLAHRTEWGRMVLHWYKTVQKGETPAVPHEKYKWNQLKALNAEIYKKYKKTPRATIERNFKKVHDELYALVRKVPEKELLAPFIGSVDLASYINSATAAHYRSARKHIQKWWKQRK